MRKVKRIEYIIPSHVLRKGNKAADYMANWGCQNVDRPIEGRPVDPIWDVELYSLQVIVNRDLQPPDRGDPLSIGNGRRGNRAHGLMPPHSG